MTDKTKDLAKLFLTPLQFDEFLKEFDDVFKRRDDETADLYTPILGKSPNAFGTSKYDIKVYKTSCRYIDILIKYEEKNLGEA